MLSTPAPALKQAIRFCSVLFLDFIPIGIESEKGALLQASFKCLPSDSLNAATRGGEHFSCDFSV